MALALALGSLAGCTPGTEQQRGAAPSPSSTSTPSRSAGPTSTAASEPEPTTTRASCTDAQRRAVQGLRTWKVIDVVTASETGFSRVAARRVREDATRAAGRVEEECGRLPAAARRYVRDVRRATTAELGHRQLDRVLAAWLRWGREVGHAKPAEREIRELQDCRDLMRGLSVSYRLWWRRTGTGRAWWVELTWDNRTGKTVTGELFGEVRVTGMLPDRFGWSAAAASSGPGRTRTEGWGGSSADMAWVRPGVSRQVLAPGADTDVHTTTNGTVDVTENEVFLYIPGPGIHPCMLPVPEQP